MTGKLSQKTATFVVALVVTTTGKRAGAVRRGDVSRIHDLSAAAS